jgi:hypothetical protein
MKHSRFTHILPLAASLALCICFTSCKKDKSTDADDDTGYVQEHSSLEKASNDVQTMTDQAAAGTPGALFRIAGNENTILSTCATITHDTTVTPHLLAIDFGAANCLCNDGYYRRGKIVCAYTGRYKDSGSVHTITYSNYFVNDNQFTGHKTVTNAGRNSQGQYYYTIVTADTMILANGAGTRGWTANRTRTWSSGYGTPAWNDDSYDMTGSGAVTRVNGKAFDIVITSPLHIAASCRWIESGTLSIISPSHPAPAVLARVVDFGSGACDALATYNYNGKTYNITMK